MSHAKTGAETPMFLGGGLRPTVRHLKLPLSPPMFLDGGLRFGSIWAIFDLFLSPPSKNMGGSGVVTDV